MGCGCRGKRQTLRTPPKKNMLYTLRAKIFSPIVVSLKSGPLTSSKRTLIRALRRYINGFANTNETKLIEATYPGPIIQISEILKQYNDPNSNELTFKD